MKKTLTVIALLVALPIIALADKPATKSATLTIKTTIDAIDHEARSITFRDKDGNYETVYAGPEVKRFDELKVGDKVTFRYTASVVVKVAKAGEPLGASAESPAIVRETGEKPGATITQQHTATVLVKAIDPKVPAVTVQTEDGHTVSHQVENKDLLKGIKPGDHVQITFTEALMISVQ